MPEWLKSATTLGDIAWETVAARLVLAALFGIVVAAIFVASTRKLVGTFTLILTLILLTILVAMTTVVIGENVARAFGLVGALSIVRFRTVVEDTRDTAFVIFAVVVGMAIGAGYIVVCLIGIPVVAVVAIGLGQLGTSWGLMGGEHRLEIRVGIGHTPEDKILVVLQEHLSAWRVLSIGTAKKGEQLEMNYAVRVLKPLGELALVRALQGVAGVEKVELMEM